ncbi:MAG: hypothetical protein AAFV53_14785 [Myxococcota bacterium]
MADHIEAIMRPFLHFVGEPTHSRLERLAGFAVIAWNISRESPQKTWPDEIEKELDRLRPHTTDPGALRPFRTLLDRMLPIAAAIAPENQRSVLDAGVRLRADGRWRLVIRSFDP